jgi:hypothetical protein
MRKKKIRGHKRRWKRIEQWRQYNLDMNLAEYLLNVDDRFYAKIRVHPWSGFLLTNSIISEPRGKTRRKIFNALLDIYEDWKFKLEKQGIPFYLKIWLYEHRFSFSQVVCATGDNIDFYATTFSKSEIVNNKNDVDGSPQCYNWEHRLDEDHYDSSDIGEPFMYESKDAYDYEVKRLEKLLKKPHRKSIFNDTVGDERVVYSFKRGNIWLGECK